MCKVKNCLLIFITKLLVNIMTLIPLNWECFLVDSHAKNEGGSSPDAAHLRDLRL